MEKRIKSSKQIEIPFLSRVSSKEKIFFVQNLKTMIGAGMTLTEGLNTLAKQTQNPKMTRTLSEMTAMIEQGKTFSQALKKYPKIFPKILINMVAAGEASGNLENILGQLHAQMKKDHDLMSKIRGAMTYPSVVLFAMVVMGIGMMVFVFPTFIQIFEDAGTELPTATKILIATSKAITENGLLVFIGFVVFVILFIRGIKTKPGKKIFHWVLLKMFILGPVAKKINLARIARSLSSLLKTDIPLVKSFEITSSVVSNVYYQDALLESIKKIEKGDTISKSLGNYPNLFPPMILQMITVGERSGATDELLDKIALFYEEEVDNTTKNLSSIVEPFLILIIGVAVGFMAIAVMMPMYNLAQQY